MFCRLSKKRAQSTLEYAILIGLIVGGLVATQTYLKRGYQGKLKESADSMGEQFSPGNTTYDYTTRSSTSSNESLENQITTTEITKQTTEKKGTESVQTFDNEDWFKK